METTKRGDLARRAGVREETLRRYEHFGLLPDAPFGDHPDDERYVDCIRFIERALQLGYSLAEVKDLFALRARCMEHVAHRATATPADAKPA